MVRRLLIATAVMVALAGGAVPAPAATATPANSGAYCAVTLPSTSLVCADTPAALATASSAGAHPDATQVLIARLYDNSNYDTGAGYLNVYAGGDCTASTSNVDASLSDLSTWSNRVSSFQSFGNCATRLWSATSFNGTAYPSSGYQINSAYVGAAFNDRAHSAQFS